MKIVYFFHSLLDENIQNISRSINVYFSKTNYSLMVNDKISFYAYKRQGLHFYWRVDPIELNYEDLGLQSEVILKGQTIKKKEITEIRISFTDFPILELYYARLVYNLLNQYEIIDGTRQISCLKGKLRFTSLYDYNFYRMKRDRDTQEELESAFSDSKNQNELESLPYEYDGGNELDNAPDKAEFTEISEENKHDTSKVKQSAIRLLPEDISVFEFDNYPCLKDVNIMSRYYPSYDPKVMRRIMLKVPGAYNNWKSSKNKVANEDDESYKPSTTRGWGPRWIKEGDLESATISRYLFGLHDLGARTINKVPIPYKPRKTKTN